MGKSNWSKEYLSTIESVRFMQNFNSEGKTDYLTALLDDRVIVFKNDKIICEKMQDDKYITGACYFGNKLFYTKEDDNKIYCLSDDVIETTELEEYDRTVILKCVDSDCFVLALYVFIGNNKMIVLYDLGNKKQLCVLPVSRIGYRDVAIDKDKNLAVILCKEKVDISRYEDDCDSRVKFLISLNLKNGQIEDDLSVSYYYDSFSADYSETVQIVKNMRFPLWKFFTQYFPVSKGISSNGRFILYYSRDFKGLIISHYENGNVYRIFHLPEGIEYDEKTYFYFNEESDVLSIIKNRKLNRFKVSQTSEELIDEINEKYSQEYYKEERWEFSEMLYKAMEGCKCVEN